MGTLAMVPSHGYTGYGAFTWVHWLWCLHMAMVPSHGYTGYGAFTWVHWLWCLHMAMVPSHGYTSYGAFDNKTLQGKKCQVERLATTSTSLQWNQTPFIIPSLPSCCALLVSYVWCGHAQIGLCVDFRSRATPKSSCHIVIWLRHIA